MIEEQVQQAMFSQNPERTFVDKVLARKEIEAIRELVKKPNLTRSEILELLYLLSSAESKLLNLDKWERYVMLKFFVWLREYIKILELLFDYIEDIARLAITCRFCRRKREEQGENPCICQVFMSVLTITDRGNHTIYNIRRLLEHNVKFLADLYLNIGRTTLSIGGAAIGDFTRQKFEMSYAGLPSNVPPQYQQPQAQKQPLLRIR